MYTLKGCIFLECKLYLYTAIIKTKQKIHIGIQALLVVWPSKVSKSLWASVSYKKEDGDASFDQGNLWKKYGVKDGTSQMRSWLGNNSFHPLSNYCSFT